MLHVCMGLRWGGGGAWQEEGGVLRVIVREGENAARTQDTAGLLHNIACDLLKVSAPP